MPLALDFSSTLVMGWILPVATTLLAMSLRVALASLLGSILLPLPRATATIARSDPMVARSRRHLAVYDQQSHAEGLLPLALPLGGPKENPDKVAEREGVTLRVGDWKSCRWPPPRHDYTQFARCLVPESDGAD